MKDRYSFGYSELRPSWGTETPPPLPLSERIRREWRVYGDIHIKAICVVVLIVGFFAAMALALHERRQAFMAECLQDRKQYECTALYEGGGTSVVVAPVPVRVR